MLGEYGLRPVSFGQGVQAPGQPNYLNLAQSAAPGMSQYSMPGLFTGGSPTQASAGYQTAVNSPYGTLGQFGDLASNYGGLVQSGGTLVTQMAGQRAAAAGLGSRGRASGAQGDRAQHRRRGGGVRTLVVRLGLRPAGRLAGRRTEDWTRNY